MTSTNPKLRSQPLWTLTLTALALATFANGAIMALSPGWWYEAVPGAGDTGPLNVHFVRDVGAAMIAAGLSIGSALLLPSLRHWIAILLLPAAAFLGLHAVFHVVDFAQHGRAAGPLLPEILGVLLPAAVVVLAFFRFRHLAMPKRGFEAALKAGERRVGVSLGYVREIARNAPRVLAGLSVVSEFTQSHDGVAPEIAHAAAIGAVMHDDCGECLQIHANFARRDAMPGETLAKLLAGSIDGLSPALAEAYRYGQAVAANDAAMEQWRLALERRIGRAAVIQLSFYVAAARFFPSFKRGTGYAKSCSLIRLDLKKVA